MGICIGVYMNACIDVYMNVCIGGVYVCTWSLGKEHDILTVNFFPKYIINT